MRDIKELYTEKITAILENRIDHIWNLEPAIRDTKIWLACEWQCDQIPDMKLLKELEQMVEEIANNIIKTL